MAKEKLVALENDLEQIQNYALHRFGMEFLDESSLPQSINSHHFLKKTKTQGC